MAPNCLEVVVFAVLATIVGAQLSCPVCNNKYDYTSCTGSQECGVHWNYCELRVHTADYYSLEYVCQEHDNCTNHETFGCKPEENEVCAYCCEDPITCQLQREDLFNFVFPTAGPPGTTQAPVVEDTTPSGSDTFTCPSCSDPFNYQSCTSAQQCPNDDYDICRLEVDTSDKNRLEYKCDKYSECPNYDLYGCKTDLNIVCAYCCLDPVDCTSQREDLFNFVYPPQPATLKP